MELKLNDINASSIGIKMGEGFMEKLYCSVPLKDPSENKSSREHGKKVNFSDTYKDERTVTLPFTLGGRNTREFIANRAKLDDILYSGKITLYEPIRNTYFRLIYKDMQPYSENIQQTFCKLSVKFCEPNPNNRTNEDIQ